MIKASTSRFQKIYDEVIKNLANQLPIEFSYHNVYHTKYVLDKVDLIGAYEKISIKDLELLQVAALYHDIGFIKQINDHEEVSCQIAERELSGLQFTKEEIKLVCGMIMATKIPQNPHGQLESILADADLEYLGTENFYFGSEKLFYELKHFDPAMDELKWLKIQIDFISAHRYHTEFCKLYREPTKQVHLAALIKRRSEIE